MNIVTEVDLKLAAAEVLRLYGIERYSSTLLQSKGPKTVWKVRAETGTYILKRFRHSPAKVAFFTEAQIYAGLNGARVPEVVRGPSGNGFVNTSAGVFGLQSFVEGRRASWARQEDFRASVEVLAAFHRGSRGYRPPAGCEVSSKLGAWPRHYEAMVTRLRNWGAEAAGDPRNGFSSSYSSAVERMIARGKFAIELLQQFNYPLWVERATNSGGLCHQDFGEGNCIINEGKAWMIEAA